MRLRLESHCISLFTSCIDFSSPIGDAIAVFDTLYSLYCQKFQGVDLEQEKFNDKHGQGLKGLVEEIDTWGMQDEGALRLPSRTKNTRDIWYVLRIIFGIFFIVCSVLYYTAIYFTLFDADAKKIIA